MVTREQAVNKVRRLMRWRSKGRGAVSRAWSAVWHITPTVCLAPSRKHVLTPPRVLFSSKKRRQGRTPGSLIAMLRQAYGRDGAEGSRALRGKGPLTLEWQQEVGEKGAALRIEYRLKQQPKSFKEQLIHSPELWQSWSPQWLPAPAKT